MNTKRILRITLQGISFCLALALCGCASEQPVAWVHPLAADGGANGSGTIVAGDHIGLHVYTNAAAQPAAAATPVEITADVEPIAR